MPADIVNKNLFYFFGVIFVYIHNMPSTPDVLCISDIYLLSNNNIQRIDMS